MSGREGSKPGRGAPPVEVDRLAAEGRLVLDPEEHVVEAEGLGPHLVRGDAGGPVLVDELARVVLLAEAVKGHRHAGVLQLGGHLHPETLEERDALGVGHQGALVDDLPARDAPHVDGLTRRGPEVLLHAPRGRIRDVPSATEGPELLEGEVAGAAAGAGRPDQRAVVAHHRGLERDRAPRGQGRGQDVGGRVQVALGMAADQLQVPGEGDVALQDPGSHAGRRLVGLAGVLGEPRGAPRWAMEKSVRRTSPAEQPSRASRSGPGSMSWTSARGRAPRIDTRPRSGIRAGRARDRREARETGKNRDPEPTADPAHLSSSPHRSQSLAARPLRHEPSPRAPRARS